MKCRQCGQEFEPKVKWQKSCSLLCSRRWLNAHPNRQTYICQYCGKEFIPKQADRITYCSRECFFAHQADKKKALAEVRAILREQRSKENNSICKLCGRQYHSSAKKNGYCSDDCRKEKERHRSKEYEKQNHTPKIFICKECGKEVATEYPNKSTSFCSSICRFRHSGRIEKAQRRARKHANGYERIDPFDIFKRDKWHCKLCGISTPRRLRGTLKANSPELDHIIPLSQRGMHTYQNGSSIIGMNNRSKKEGGSGRQFSREVKPVNREGSQTQVFAFETIRVKGKNE